MVVNFGAGPAKLPAEVLVEVQKNLINYNGTGLSVMEMSHRSKDYDRIHDGAIQSLRDLLNIPDNYKVLLMQGGGTGAFAAVCMNLIGRTGTADYLVTGTWSAKAAKEAAKYGKVNLVLPKASMYTEIPAVSAWKLDPNASFLYYCDNETVDGVEFPFVPETSNGVPLVVDMSSNILSRPIDISKFGVIFAGAQKNIGPAGITVVIVREDLIGHALKETPSVFDFKVASDNNSLANTPPTFIIHVIGLVFEWIKRQGGVDAMYANSVAKSQKIYKALADSDGFYVGPVAKDFRSRMNLPFRIVGSDSQPSDELEKEFLRGAEERGMLQLKGHRSVGGIRASLYNAVTVQEANILATYMIEFWQSKQSK